MSGVNELASLIHMTMVDQDGEKIGKVAQIYVDTSSDESVWLAVHMGLLGRNASLVPMASMTVQGESELVTTCTKQQVEEAPDLDGDDNFSSDEEMALYAYYGMNYFQGGLTGAPDVAAVDVADAAQHGFANSRLRKFSPDEKRSAGVPVAHTEDG